MRLRVSFLFFSELISFLFLPQSEVIQIPGQSLYCCCYIDSWTQTIVKHAMEKMENNGKPKHQIVHD